MATSLGLKQAINILGLDESIIETAYPNTEDRKFLKPISELTKKLSLNPEQVQVLTNFQPIKKKVLTKKQKEKQEQTFNLLDQITTIKAEVTKLTEKAEKAQTELAEKQKELDNLMAKLTVK